jgi:hypothetical protein
LWAWKAALAASGFCAKADTNQKKNMHAFKTLFTAMLLLNQTVDRCKGKQNLSLAAVRST